MAAGAGLDSRLTAFIAGYVLVLAVLGPVAAGHADLLVRDPGAVRPGRAPVGRPRCPKNHRSTLPS